MFSKNRMTRIVLMVCAAMLLTASTGCDVQKVIEGLLDNGDNSSIQPVMRN